MLQYGIDSPTCFLGDKGKVCMYVYANNNMYVHANNNMYVYASNNMYV